MGTNFQLSYRIWGTILIGLFLLLGSFGFVNAQENEGAPIPTLYEEEGISDPNPDLIEGEEEIATTKLQETSQLLLELNEIEENKPPSGISISVDSVKGLSVKLGVFGFLLLLLLVNVAFLVREGSEYSKKIVFTLMVLVVSIPTLYFIISTVYVNVISTTKGPVHWHADFKVYACGDELIPPAPPHKLSNKTGTPVLHQHEDKRLHVEGVVVDLDSVSLRSFFEVQGGEMDRRSIKVPTGYGFKTYTNGDTCNDDKVGIWNVFLYKVNAETNEVTKSKLDDFPNHILSPYINVPPGDCLIFEFGENIDDTDNICDFYHIAINKGEIIPTWTQ
jgi:hypothetical protein